MTTARPVAFDSGKGQAPASMLCPACGEWIVERPRARHTACWKCGRVLIEGVAAL